MEGQTGAFETLALKKSVDQQHDRSQLPYRCRGAQN